MKTAIYKGVRHVLQQEEKPGLLKVVRYLQTSDDQDVKNVGDLLYEIGTNGVAKLMFSEGDVDGISLSEKVNILQIQNLNLPDEGHYYLMSERQTFISSAEGGAQPNISRTKIVNFKFPIPPLAEQKRIVARIEEILELTNRMKNSIKIN